MQPFVAVLAFFDQGLHGGCEVFVFAVGDAEDAFASGAVYGHFYELAVSYFLAYEGPGEEGKTQVGHDGVLDGCRVVIYADDVVGYVVLAHDLLEQFTRAASFFSDEKGEVIGISCGFDIFAGPFAFGGCNECHGICQDGFCRELGRGKAAFDEGEVDFVIEEHLLEFFGIMDSGEDFQIGPELACVLQEVDEEYVANGDAGADPYRHLLLQGMHA